MFWFYAGILLTAVLAVALYGLLRRRRGGEERSRERALRAIYQDRISALDRDLRLGTLAEEQFSAMRLEVEREFLRDLKAAAAADPERQKQPPRLLWSAYCLAVLLPALVFGLYFKLGSPDFSVPDAAAPESKLSKLPSVEEMVAALAARLAQQPGDLADWMLLARSYMTLERYSEAAAAMQQAYSLTKGDRPEVLLQYASALSMANNGQLAGRPAELVERALALEPGNADGLWLAGLVALESGDFPLALERWRQLTELLRNEPEALARLERMIAHVEQRSGGEPPGADSPAGAIAPPAAPQATGAASTEAAAKAHAGSLQVRVSISPALLAAADPGDTVFVFARAPEGPPMPVAATRRRVGDLPLEVTLDDSASVMPTARLSSFRRVQVSARVSKSGNAMPQSGDLKAGPADAVPGSGATLNLVIDQTIP